MIKVGSWVKICIKPKDDNRSVLGKLNGEIHKVSKIKVIGQEAYYELKDVKSDKGIPYCFEKRHLEEQPNLLG